MYVIHTHTLNVEYIYDSCGTSIRSLHISDDNRLAMGRRTGWYDVPISDLTSRGLEDPAKGPGDKCQIKLCIDFKYSVLNNSRSGQSVLTNKTVLYPG